MLELESQCLGLNIDCGIWTEDARENTVGRFC